MGNPFVWFDLRSKDAAASQKFYENLLGWQVREMPGGEEPLTMIGEPEPWAGIVNDSESTGWVPYIQVPDVDAATKKAQQLGARVARDKTTGPAGVFTTIEDPSGAQVALWQPN